MAKSSYLDNLLKGTLPAYSPKNQYLSSLWDISELPHNVISFDLSENLSSSSDVALTSDSYLTLLSQKNQTVLDNTSYRINQITLNSEYLPIKLHNLGITPAFRKDSTFTGIVDYLPAVITSNKGGAVIDTLPILFPRSFSRSIQSSFAQEHPVGSTVPIVAYSHTEAEQIPLEFDALSDYLPEGIASLKDYVDRIMNILKPKISGQAIYEPTVTVSFADITFKGVCTSVSVSYDNLYGDKSFVHATISCQFIRLG